MLNLQRSREERQEPFNCLKDSSFAAVCVNQRFFLPLIALESRGKKHLLGLGFLLIFPSLVLFEANDEGDESRKKKMFPHETN